ncbi:hypothetical protein IW261DRAFT_1425994 [Armillaria novae-zelandiae]|uniref:Uncharacterized protein n=1 Tax=Armillaria novae-zelandiae TaxID=153914 RepID=A0AA39TSK0_9AGAR|nr:hypothetical protein IW261DRAFT_1425994 [Armillaria novae-zelandiae]
MAVPALSASIQARDGSWGDDYGKDNGRGNCTWEPVFEHKNEFKGWNQGKYTPYDHKEFEKITFEIAYQHDEKDDKFVCELFVEIIDINTWENDCHYGKDDKDRKKDDKKYYDTSCWNAHYGW